MKKRSWKSATNLLIQYLNSGANHRCMQYIPYRQMYNSTLRPVVTGVHIDEATIQGGSLGALRYRRSHVRYRKRSTLVVCNVQPLVMSETVMSASDTKKLPVRTRGSSEVVSTNCRGLDWTALWRRAMLSSVDLTICSCSQLASFALAQVRSRV